VKNQNDVITATSSMDNPTNLQQQLEIAVSGKDIPLIMTLLASGADPCLKSKQHRLAESPLLAAIPRANYEVSEISLQTVECLVAFANNPSELQHAAERATEGAQNTKILACVLQRLKKIEQEVSQETRTGFAEKLIEWIGLVIVREQPGLEIEFLEAVRNYHGDAAFSYGCFQSIINFLPMTHVSSHHTVNLNRYNYVRESLILPQIDLYCEENEEYRANLQRQMERYIGAIEYILAHSKKEWASDFLINFAQLGCCYDIHPSKHHTIPLTNNVERIVGLLSSNIAATDLPYASESLYHAAEHNNARLLWILLKTGCYNDWQTNMGDTALHIAAERLNPLIVEILLAVNPFLTQITNQRKITARDVLNYFGNKRIPLESDDYYKFEERVARCVAAFEQAEERIKAICAQQLGTDPVSLVRHYARGTELSESFFALRTVPGFSEKNNVPAALNVASSQSDSDKVMQEVNTRDPGETKQAFEKALQELNVSAVVQLLNAVETIRKPSTGTSELDDNILVKLMGISLSETKELQDYNSRLEQIHSFDPQSEKSIIHELQERQLQIMLLFLQKEHSVDALTKAVQLSVSFAGNARCTEKLLAILAAMNASTSSNESEALCHSNPELIKTLTQEAFKDTMLNRSHRPLTAPMIQVLNRFGANFTLKHAQNILTEFPDTSFKLPIYPSLSDLTKELFLKQRTRQCLTLLQAFYQNGANPNKLNSEGNSFLHVLVSSKNLFCWNNFNTYQSIIEILRSAGANLNLQDKEGKTPLHHAFKGKRGDNEALLTALVAAGADLTVTDVNGRTPLHTAILAKDWWAATFLLQQNPGVISVKDNNGETAKDLTDRVRKQGASSRKWFDETAMHALLKIFIEREQTVVAEPSKSLELSA
jgi:ankyrin repeat protein